MKKYRVAWLIDDTYQVMETIPHSFSDGAYEELEEESAFQGGLADCEAYIRLNEEGYMS